MKISQANRCIDLAICGSNVGNDRGGIGMDSRVLLEETPRGFERVHPREPITINGVNLHLCGRCRLRDGPESRC